MAGYIYSTMNKPINSILVPVDFSMNTSIAISKALSLCQEGNKDATIHLYHVQRLRVTGTPHMLSSVFAGYTRRQVNSDIRSSSERLEQLKAAIAKQRKDIRVVCWVSFGEPVQESIIKKARQLSADLIIIGKTSHHSILPFLNTVVPSKLAAITGVPVLTAKPGSLHQDIKTVVIPIGPDFPGSKLEMLEALKNRSHPSVKLVIFGHNDHASTASKQLLFDTFRAFKRRYPNNVNYEMIDGRNRAKALLKYCHKVGADVLIVYPGAETRTGSWFNSHISDLVPAGSKTQVLAVMPG